MSLKESFLEQKMLSLEHTIMRHEDEINKIKDNHHTLDKNVLEIGVDVKMVLEKLDIISDNNKELDNRLKTLEEIYKDRQAFARLFYRVCNLAYRLRWLFLCIFLLSCAVDVDVKVQNPQLIDYLYTKIPPIFHKA